LGLSGGRRPILAWMHDRHHNAYRDCSISPTRRRQDPFHHTPDIKENAHYAPLSLHAHIWSIQRCSHRCRPGPLSRGASRTKTKRWSCSWRSLVPSGCVKSVERTACVGQGRDVTCVFSHGAEDGSFPEELWVILARLDARQQRERSGAVLGASASHFDDCKVPLQRFVVIVSL